MMLFFIRLVTSIERGIVAIPLPLHFGLRNDLRMTIGIGCVDGHVDAIEKMTAVVDGIHNAVHIRVPPIRTILIRNDRVHAGAIVSSLAWPPVRQTRRSCVGGREVGRAAGNARHPPSVINSTETWITNLKIRLHIGDGVQAMS